MKRKHNVWVSVLLLMCWCTGLCVVPLASQAGADFVVSDILVQKDGFVYIKLENRSNVDVPVKGPVKEKIFLTIYINNLKRAEYKVKYINAALFKKRGRYLFRTNFRLQQPLLVKAEVNRLKIFPETNHGNNQMTKKMVPGKK